MSNRITAAEAVQLTKSNAEKLLSPVYAFVRENPHRGIYQWTKVYTKKEAGEIASLLREDGYSCEYQEDKYDDQWEDHPDKTRYDFTIHWGD